MGDEGAESTTNVYLASRRWRGEALSRTVSRQDAGTLTPGREGCREQGEVMVVEEKEQKLARNSCRS